ncbi:uncharacterized protein LOC117789131 [Drosophila innubila]|uniref:uncharacterized protein LOC117789131 n=1 Tax=Drosophila innubila TaxID=198719 RepID=UPI00148D7E85|nr:uncharacterized protein LOC117789131 [Drosophila innubila]
MDTLDNDCQLLIIKYLSLRDQLSLFELTNEEPTNRVNSNLHYAWQHQLSFHLDEDHFEVFVEKPEILHGFLSIICTTVHHLTLWDVTLDRLTCWKHYNFSEMKSLEFRLNYDYNDMMNGYQVIQLMGDLFPEIHNIKLCDKFDMIHLRNWKHLRKLDLTQCFPIFRTDESSWRISELKMLEELIINHEELNEEQFEILVNLPKLQILTLEFLAKNRLNCIIKMRAMDIQKITLNGFCLNELSDAEKLINLRQVTLVNIKITRENIQKLIKGLPLLKRLDIIDSRILSSEIELWQTFACCPSLQILNVSNVKLHEGFFSLNRRPIEMVLNRRWTPLSVNWHNTIENELIRSYLKHPNLNVSFEPFKIDYIAYCVEIKFSP